MQLLNATIVNLDVDWTAAASLLHSIVLATAYRLGVGVQVCLHGIA